MKNNTFTTLNISINYNAAMLADKNSAEHVGAVVNYLVRQAELDKLDSNKEIVTLKTKVADALNDSTEGLTAEEKETWEAYQTHKRTLEKLRNATGITRAAWEKENDVDKLFFQLIALPNMPKAFNSVDFLPGVKWEAYKEIAEKYYNGNAKEAGKVDAMRQQLEYDFMKLKNQGSIFRGVKVKPNATDTRKFLSLFIKGLKLENGKYDFSTLYGKNTKADKVKAEVNNFLAMYITNRMDAVSAAEEAKENK